MQESTSSITAEQAENNFRRWWAAMEASHTMLMAGLRDRVGPDADVQQAYRDWQAVRGAEKLKAYERAAKRFHALQSQMSLPEEAS